MLEITRTLLDGYAGILRDGHVAASDIAEAWFGSDKGFAITIAIVNLVKALRDSRRSPFRFSNPGCPVCREMATPQKRLLLKIMLHIANGRAAGARRPSRVAKAMTRCQSCWPQNNCELSWTQSVHSIISRARRHFIDQSVAYAGNQKVASDIQ